MVSTKMVINGVKRNLVPIKEYKKPLLKLNSKQIKMFDKLEIKKESLLKDIESMEAELKEPHCLTKNESQSLKDSIANKLNYLSGLVQSIRQKKKDIYKKQFINNV